MTIKDIAGFCPEEAIWKMMADVSSFLLKDCNVYTLTPDTIVIDGNTFMIEPCLDVDSEFLAPEQCGLQSPAGEQMIWSLGAVIYYMATGHIIFGGHGGKYQREHPAVSLPIMPKSLQALTPIVHKCVDVCPSKRISLEKLNVYARNGLEICSKRQREKQDSSKAKPAYNEKQGEKWPEKMMEI